MNGKIGKTNENRFTLLFNPNDPIQKNAIDTLNALGHGKARFIALAIQSYQQLSGASPPSDPVDFTAYKAYIEKTVKELLDQRGVSSQQKDLPPAPSERPKTHTKITSAVQDDTETLGNANRFLAGINAFKSR